MAVSATTIYLATTIVSIFIAILLIMVARSSSPIKSPPVSSPGRKQTIPASSDEELHKTIMDALARRGRSAHRPRDVAEALTQVFDQELEKRVTAKAAEVNSRFEKIFDQKAQNEEIAWKKYERVLSQKKDTDAVIRSIAQGLVVVDSKGKVVMMNPAAEKLLGSSRKQKLGRSIAEGLRDDQLLSMVKSDPDKDEREIELMSQADETKKVLRASSAVVENENGQAVGMVSVLSDITKQKELDNLKAAFVANVSHELRTPLIAIDKSVALILGGSTGSLTREQEQFLSIAERNLKRLSRLINDLLDLSRLEAGKMALKRETCSLPGLIKDTVDSLANWVRAKGLGVSLDVPDELPPVNVDPDRIIQVLTNLIGNAVKFTPSGKQITVSAQVAGDREIVITVADQGIGIPGESLPKIFDKFYQVGERVATDIHGTGIGLSISREIVNRHGGRIWVESEKGEGARFVFALPLGEEVKAAAV
ncbi:MAG: cell wall metabolism sensor histidine kinase WalK [Candidatus Omnitrophica bacterium]|nr:cell wall metabolism sensor histidine kinase WalK [Candidatus Omnitrophota bacterium]